MYCTPRNCITVRHNPFSRTYPVLPQVYASGVTILPSPMFGAIMQIILTRLLFGLEIEIRRGPFALSSFREKKSLETFYILANPVIWKVFKRCQFSGGQGTLPEVKGQPKSLINIPRGQYVSRWGFFPSGHCGWQI